MPQFPHNPWFDRLAPADAAALLAAASPLRLRRGEILFHEGDAADSPRGAFFGVTSGMLHICALHADGSEGVIGVVEPGNWVGEVALLEQLPRAYGARAQEESSLLAVTAQDFARLMQRASFAQAIARLLAGRLRMAMGGLGNAALGTRERVARRLAILAHGDATQAAAPRASITTSQETLAAMLGISRPTLNKELRELEKAGAVVLHYGRIDITDLALLLAQ